MVKKFLSVQDSMSRYGLCRNTINKLADEAGARVHVGRRVLIDVEKLDAYLEAQAEGGEE